MKSRLPFTTMFCDAFRMIQENPLKNVSKCKAVPETFIGHFIQSIGLGLISSSIDEKITKMLLDMIKNDLYCHYKYENSSIDTLITDLYKFQNNKNTIRELFDNQIYFFEIENYDDDFQLNELNIDKILKEIIEEIFDTYLPTEDDIKKLEFFRKKRKIL